MTAFSFFTILPSRRARSIADVAATCYLLPLVAAVVGALDGLAGWGGVHAFGAPVAAASMLAVALLATGLHHADGLADLGDALMARGDAARRLAVLKDRTLGTGAAGALVITYLISWAALLQLASIEGGAALIWYLMAAEICARLALLLVAALGKPSHEGSGSAFLAAVKGPRGAAGITASFAALALLMLPLGPAPPLLAGGAALLAAVLVIIAGRRWFGGIGGDLLGAALELGRMGALTGLAAALTHWPAA